VYWTFSTDHTLIAPVTVADDVVYAGTFSKSYTRNVFALQKANGTLLWNKDAGDDVIAAPVVAQGRVYVPMVRELVALDAGTGAELWRYQGNRDLHGSPLVMGDQVWVLRSGDMLALNVATGAVTSQTPTSEGSVIAGCSSDGRALFIGFFDGTLKSFVGGTP
jgi:outer membrane protein assembly factor BamB